MTMKRTVVAIFLTLAMCGASWAQNNEQQQAQYYLNSLPKVLQYIQMRAGLTSQMASMAQSVGNSQQMQLCQMENQMHRAMYEAMAQAQQNPQRLTNPTYRKQLDAALEEYMYRAESRDMRPYEQIAPQIQQHAAYTRWKRDTPEGRATHQAEINRINGSTAQTRANTQSQYQTTQYINDQNQQTYNASQQSAATRQEHTGRAINGEFQYADPNNGNTYWVPTTTNYPAVINPDGTWTDLEKSYR